MFNFLLLAVVVGDKASGPLETPQRGTMLPATNAALGLVMEIKRGGGRRNAAEIAGNSLFLALTRWRETRPRRRTDLGRRPG
ncbi:MAG: hypothetical protein HZA89_03375 [Verrucomicrobia bacterium]|nr:hypothetical protein [Verrucomicrobiota bacterium]